MKWSSLPKHTKQMGRIKEQAAFSLKHIKKCSEFSMMFKEGINGPWRASWAVQEKVVSLLYCDGAVCMSSHRIFVMWQEDQQSRSSSYGGGVAKRQVDNGFWRRLRHTRWLSDDKTDWDWWSLELWDWGWESPLYLIEDRIDIHERNTGTYFLFIRTYLVIVKENLLHVINLFNN